MPMSVWKRKTFLSPHQKSNKNCVIKLSSILVKSVESLSAIYSVKFLTLLQTMKCIGSISLEILGVSSRPLNVHSVVNCLLLQKNYKNTGRSQVFH